MPRLRERRLRAAVRPWGPCWWQVNPLGENLHPAHHRDIYYRCFQVAKKSNPTAPIASSPFRVKAPRSPLNICKKLHGKLSRRLSYIPTEPGRARTGTADSLGLLHPVFIPASWPLGKFWAPFLACRKKKKATIIGSPACREPSETRATA